LAVRTLILNAITCGHDLAGQALTQDEENCEVNPSNDSRKRRSGNYKMSGSALLGNASLVPIDDVDQFPWILTELNLQLALFVDR
jgi:hypothetical protein